MPRQHEDKYTPGSHLQEKEGRGAAAEAEEESEEEL